MEDSEEYIIFDCVADLGKDALEHVQEIRRLDRLCDVTLVVQDKRFRAHKMWLAATIPYFKAMFLSDMVEAGMDEIEIHDIEAEAFATLLKFVYSGKITISVDNVQSLLFGASILQIQPVRNQCCNFIRQHLCASNCIAVKQLAEQLNCYDLMDIAKKYLLRHFKDIVVLDEFTNIAKDDLIQILNDDNLCVNTEEEVFDAVMRWMNANHERLPDLYDMMDCVRLPLISPNRLCDRISRDPLIRSSLRCRDLLDDARDYHLLPERRSQMDLRKVTPRLSFETSGIIYVVGGLNSAGESVTEVEYFDQLNNRWQPAPSMLFSRSRLGVCCQGGKLYAMGGFDGFNRLASAEVFCRTSRKWTPISDMLVARSASSCDSLESRVLVCGGYDGHSSMNSVELYEPARNAWRLVSSMQRNRSAACAAVLGDRLYVLGGHDGLSIFNTVETYDAALDRWMPDYCRSMLTKRCRLGAAVLMGRIYACGGYDSASFLQTMEAFDPRSNRWTQLGSMSTKRSRVCLVANQGQLFAIGGYDGVLNLQTVEVYEPRKDCWVEGQRMQFHEGGVGATVLC